MSMTVAFVDTLCFLHYPWLSDLDWPAMLEADAVEILLAPIVINELDKKKNDGTSKKRQRARDALRRIMDTLDRTTADLRHNVTLRYIAREPSIDFDAHRLSATHADDRLIATVIEYKSEYPNVRVVIVTDDTGLTLKSRAHAIEVKGMPFDRRLKDETDEQTLENRRLKAALSEYVNRLPRLRVIFNDGGTIVCFL